MGMLKQDDGWRLPDEIRDVMETLLPERKPHPLGCHRPRVNDRSGEQGCCPRRLSMRLTGPGWPWMAR